MVVGEAKVAAFPVLIKSKWCFSNNSVAPREEPMLIPKVSPVFHPASIVAFREAAIANKTELSNDLNFSILQFPVLKLHLMAPQVHFDYQKRLLQNNDYWIGSYSKSRLDYFLMQKEKR